MNDKNALVIEGVAKKAKAEGFCNFTPVNTFIEPLYVRYSPAANITFDKVVLGVFEVGGMVGKGKFDRAQQFFTAEELLSTQVPGASTAAAPGASK